MKFVNPIHFATDLLDPALQSCNLKPEELLEAISFISGVGNHMGLIE